MEGVAVFVEKETTLIHVVEPDQSVRVVSRRDGVERCVVR